MKKFKKYLAVAYLLIGTFMIFWAYYAGQSPSSEAVIGATLFIVGMSFPISYPIGAWMFDLINKYWPNSGLKFIPMSILLIIGYLQWFYLIPFLKKKFIDRILSRSRKE